MFDNLDPRQQAMLMMAAGLLSPQPRNMGKGAQFAASLGQGIQGGLLGYNQAMQEQRRAQALAEETRIRKMQADQMQSQADREGKIAALGPQFFSQGNAPADGMGPVSPPKQDFAGYAQALTAIDPRAGIPLMQSLSKQEAPLVLKEGEQAFTRDGKPLFGNAKKEKPLFQPGQTRELKLGREYVTQEYDGTNWRTIAKSAMDKPDGPDKPPAAPQGYQWTQDGKGLQPIPGGPADAKVGKEAEALKKREEGALARADFVLGQVGKAIEESGTTTAGPMGAVLRNVPGTGAYNLNKTIDSIKANIGFSELQAMREASPTGGALGQVAVQELNMLQSVFGSLDTAQSPQQLEKTLYAIEKHYSNWKRAVQGAGAQPKKSSGWGYLGTE